MVIGYEAYVIVAGSGMPLSHLDWQWEIPFNFSEEVSPMFVLTPSNPDQVWVSVVQAAGLGSTSDAEKFRIQNGVNHAVADDD